MMESATVQLAIMGLGCLAIGRTRLASKGLEIIKRAPALWRKEILRARVPKRAVSSVTGS